jgi:hypothetical protein
MKAIIMAGGVGWCLRLARLTGNFNPISILGCQAQRKKPALAAGFSFCFLLSQSR